MDVLNQQVRRARRRLFVQQFLTSLGWCWFALLAVATAAVLIPKFWPLDINPTIWTAAWIGGGLALGLVLAAGWTWWRRRGALDAAWEIDRRFGLKERVSSSLSLAADERESEAGQALIADAQRRVDRLELSEKFRIWPSRRALLLLLPAAAAFALIFVADKGRENQAAATALTAANKQQIENSGEQVRRLAAKREADARDKGLKEAEALFRQIEERTRDLADKSKADPKKALAQLNDLAQQLENRRQKLGGDDRLRQQLDQMKNFKAGPADEMARAMKNGDFQKALNELEKMKEQLAKGELDPEKKQALGEQLNQMEKALQKMADAQEKAKAEAQQQQKQQQAVQQAAEKALQKQIDQAKQQGDQAKADELQKQMQQMQAANKAAGDQLQQQIDKLAAQSPQAQRAKNLADKLGQASKAMQNGQTKEAQQALDQLGKEMQSMQQQAEEMQMLDEAMNQIAQAKESMTCKQCNGAGCEACQGKGKSDKPGQGDFAQGEGQASGKRPEAKTDYKTRDSKVGQKVGAGGAVVKDLVDGPNIKGQVQQGIKESVEAAKHEEADPLVGQRLPRSQREYVKEYFDSLRKGE